MVPTTHWLTGRAQSCDVFEAGNPESDVHSDEGSAELSISLSGRDIAEKIEGARGNREDCVQDPQRGGRNNIKNPEIFIGIQMGLLSTW